MEVYRLQWYINPISKSTNYHVVYDILLLPPSKGEYTIRRLTNLQISKLLNCYIGTLVNINKFPLVQNLHFHLFGPIKAHYVPGAPQGTL